MGSIERRLERLSMLSFTADKSYSAGTSARGWQRYFHAHENARRGLHGLEPMPDLEYTEEDREDDRRCLLETIPAYRNSRSGGTEQMSAFLDSWERDLQERLGKEAT